MTQGELFHVKQPGVRNSAPLPATDRLVWTKLPPTTVTVCDICAQAYIDDPFAPFGRRARYKRKAGTEITWFCYPHANAQRVADGKMPYKTPKGPR